MIIKIIALTEILLILIMGCLLQSNLYWNLALIPYLIFGGITFGLMGERK